MTTNNKNILYCSFCGKSQHEVRKLIAGPTVFICDLRNSTLPNFALNFRANPACIERSSDTAWAREMWRGQSLNISPLGLAMRLRIHAVHADDPHMRICASRCACKNPDADQPHIEQKRVLQRQILQIHVV